jgi:superfamily II DNA or RNA helicase
LPTGGGKTLVAAAIMSAATQRGTRCLFIADRCTLIGQTVATLARAGVTAVRVVQAERDDGPRDAAVTVASAQTLRMPGWADRLPDPDLTIWDEAQHVAARTYEATLARWPSARLLGLSATPCRGDGRPLSVFDELVVGASVRELIDLGHLVPPRVLPPPQGALADGQLALDPLTAWQRHAGGQRAAVFCSSVEQARQYAVDFQAAGHTAEVVTATSRDRAGALARFAAGTVTALCSVGTLTEGWDDPGCGVAIVARKPAHVGLWLQICGRVLRPAPGKREGLILDLGGAFWEHGPPDQERTYSLTGRAISTVVRDNLTQCRACGSGFLSGPRTCPYCAAELPMRERALPRATGVGLVDPAAPARPRQECVVAMTSTRRGRCTRCAVPIRPGDDIRWATVARVAQHRVCPVQPQAAP